MKNLFEGVVIFEIPFSHGDAFWETMDITKSMNPHSLFNVCTKIFILVGSGSQQV